MADDLRGKWKETGKGLGFAFRDLGKTIIKSGATSVKTAEMPSTQNALAEEASAPASEKKAPNFCPNCGSALNKDAKFCPDCGNAL